MSKTKGTTNKTPADHPEFLDMPVEERLTFVANLIVDQLLEESASTAKPLKELGTEKALA
jgi:hypothetical protein